MSTGSDYLFTLVSNFVLNQLLGYQDVNEIKNSVHRLEAAFSAEHAWDRTTDDTNPPTWATAYPDYDIGEHVGDIGVAGETTYYGDGSNLTLAPKVVTGSYVGTHPTLKTITPTGFETSIDLLIVSGLHGAPGEYSFWFVHKSSLVLKLDAGAVGTMGGTMTAQSTSYILLNALNFQVLDYSVAAPNQGGETYQYVAIGV